MSRTVKVALAALVVVAVGLGIFAACSATSPGSAESPGPTTTSGPGGESPAEGDDGVTSEDLTAALFAAQENVVASAEGEIPNPGNPIPATVEVTDVYAGPTSTVVRFTLATTSEKREVLHPMTFNKDRMLTDDIRDVSLVDEKAQVRLRPFVGGKERPWDGYCTCSFNPRGVSSTGLPLTATFPPLEGGDTVTVEIPGFPPLENVTVRRD